MIAKLTLMFICGDVTMWAVMVMILILPTWDKLDQEDVPSDEDMEQMRLWYDNEYGKEK